MSVYVKKFFSFVTGPKVFFHPFVLGDAEALTCCGAIRFATKKLKNPKVFSGGSVKRFRYKVLLLRLFPSAFGRTHQASRKAGVVLLFSVGFEICPFGFHIPSRSKLSDGPQCKILGSLLEYIFRLRQGLKKKLQQKVKRHSKGFKVPTVSMVPSASLSPKKRSMKALA